MQTNDVDHDPMIGVAIGRYVIRSRLAQGGMGAVYLATHESLNVKKVVKVLLPEYSRHDVIRQRFEREAKAAASFGNSHIVAIDDFGTLTDGQLFLMMPFLQGRPLDAHIAQHGRLSQHHTLQIIVQVCDALTTLHDAGVVHRDLKPGNIFISETPDNAYHVTIIDLGIARDAKSEDLTFKTHTGMAMGTPGYMAVEQFSNAASAGPAADVYAVGVVTWEMLTGQMPWGIHDARVLYHLQMTTTPEPPGGHLLSPQLLDLLRRTLSPRPEDRPPSAQLFAIAFASMTAAIPPHVPSGAEVLARYAKRLVQNVAPDLETVRNGANTDRSAPVVWPHRETSVPPLASKSPVSGGGALAVSTPISPPASAATANDRPVPAFSVQTPTTLGAASGVSTPHTRTSSPKRSTLALLGLTGCVVATIVTLAVVKFRSPGGSTAAADQPAEERAQHERTPTASAPIDAGTASVVAADASVAATPTDAAIDQAIVATTPDAGLPAPTTRTKRVRADTKKQPPAESSRTTRKPSADTFDPNAVEE